MATSRRKKALEVTLRSNRRFNSVVWVRWHGRKLVMAIAVLSLVTLWVASTYLSPHRMASAFQSLDGETHVSFHRQVPTSPSIVVHLDLKGSPPTLPFLKKFLELIAREGADGLLIEYEDMFPFEGRLANLSARNAYSKSEVRKILKWAEECGLHVIPLVQTFGHFEYALKLQEFRHLREHRSFPQALCPSNPESMKLVTEIVEQVMALHTPSSRFLHVGCDEVFQMNSCGRCAKRKLKSSELFEEYVLKVVRMVRSKYPGVTPLMWDDMLRRFKMPEIINSPLSELVEPVVWDYTSVITNVIPNHYWFTLGRTFPRLWGAAAYRGASGAFAVVPNLRERLQNVVSWRRRQVMQGAGEAAPPPAGLVLTGWARYDHFASLAELLPLAVPSLVLALQAARSTGPLWKDGGDESGWRDPPLRWWGSSHGGSSAEKQKYKWTTELVQRWRSSLRCPLKEQPWPSLDVDPSQWELAKCKFLGQDVFAAMRLCHRALSTLQFHEGNPEDEINGWLLEYHIARRFSSPYYALTALDTLTMVRAMFVDCRTTLTRALEDYVDNHTTLEWLAQRIEPAEKRLKALEEAATSLAQVEVWPRRPLD